MNTKRTASLVTISLLAGSGLAAVSAPAQAAPAAVSHSVSEGPRTVRPGSPLIVHRAAGTSSIASIGTAVKAQVAAKKKAKKKWRSRRS